MSKYTSIVLILTCTRTFLLFFLFCLDQPNEHTTGCLECIPGIDCNYTKGYTKNLQNDYPDSVDDRTGKNKIAIAGSGSRNGGTSSNTTILPSNALQQCIKQNGFDVNEKSCLCGSKICDAASGLVCNIDGEDCSSPCLGGENCCSIFFEEKDSIG